MSDVVDHTDKNPRPGCAWCGRIGEAARFGTKLIYANKFNERGKLVMTRTRFTVCDGTPCGDELQAAAG